MSGRLATIAAALCLTSATLALLPASAATGPDARTLAGDGNGQAGYTAQIRRTAYGIPHILAKDFGGLGYGYGYAFAQDNVCELADQVATLRGERSQFFGPDGDSGPGANLASDTYYKGQPSAGTVRRLLDRKAPFEGPVITIEVADIDAALASVVRLGGEAVIGRQAVGDMGFTGYFRDTEGNLIGLWQNA